jgi:two-component system, chemotaxis family, chemotaxis protein CheY
MRMLFVDDDSFARAAFVRFFEQYGRNGEAENGKQAVAAFKSAHEAGDPFHLVFMDISMPVMDGHEALRHMRRIEGEMGIRGKNRFTAVMASALDDRQNLGESFLEDGAEMYVTKPVNFPALVSALEKTGILRREEA